MKNYFKFFKVCHQYLNSDDSPVLINVILITIFLVYGITVDFIPTNNLNQRSAYAIGVITERKTPDHRFNSIFYEYYINDTIYKGATTQPYNSKIRIGDSIIVKYEYTNPGNKEIYLIFEYTLDRSKLPDTVFHRQPIDWKRQPY